MKKFLAAISLLIPTLTLANTINLPVTCIAPKDAEKVIKDYKEELIFIGKDNAHKVDNLGLTVFVNKQTKTYSVFLVSLDKNVVCVISSGIMGTLVHNQ